MASLADIFSASNDQFARVIKPAEFESKKRPAVVEEKKIKKPKHKKREKEGQDGSKENSFDKNVQDKPIAPTSISSSNSSSNLPESTSDVTTTPPANNNCTIFVGNLPLSANVKSISKLFKQFGEIDSVRLRSVPVAGTKVLTT